METNLKVLPVVSYESKEATVFRRLHREKNRHVYAEVLAKKGSEFIRYEVCPRQVLDMAALLNRTGHDVTGAYVYNTPIRGFNTYSEGDPWLVGSTKGLTTGQASLRAHCSCR